MANPAVLALIVSLLLWPLQIAQASPESLACSQSLARPLTRAQPGFGEQIRILIWNIEKSSNPGWDKDLTKLGGNAELILIQEASLQAEIGSTLPQHLYQAFAPGYATTDLETGVLTLSSIEPSLACSLTAWEPWLKTPKATNVTEYPIGGFSQRLLVINLHAVNFSVGLEEFEEQIRALAPLLKQHRGPLIVAGDFNTWSKNRLHSLELFMRNHQLSPVAFSPDLRTRFLKMPLDHIYLRGLKLLEARTVKVKSSDHNPLLITVEIPRG